MDSLAPRHKKCRLQGMTSEQGKQFVSLAFVLCRDSFSLEADGNIRPQYVRVREHTRVRERNKQGSVCFQNFSANMLKFRDVAQ